MTEMPQEPDDATPPLASPALRGDIAEVGKVAQAVQEKAADVEVRPRSTFPSAVALTISAFGLVVTAWQAMEARRVPLDLDSVRRGLELQAVRVRVELIRTGRMPASLDDVGRLDPAYVLVPMGDYRFRVELVADADTFAVQSSVDAREYIWLPPRSAEAQP